MKKVKMEKIMKLFELNTPEEKEIEKNAKIAVDTMKKSLMPGAIIDTNKVKQANTALNKWRSLKNKKILEVDRALRIIKNKAAK